MQMLFCTRCVYHNSVPPVDSVVPLHPCITLRVPVNGFCCLVSWLSFWSLNYRSVASSPPPPWQTSFSCCVLETANCWAESSPLLSGNCGCCCKNSSSASHHHQRHIVSVTVISRIETGSMNGCAGNHREWVWSFGHKATIF